MARIPTLKKLLKENFTDSPAVQRITGSINQFMTETVNAFNKGLTFNDNFSGETKTIVVDGTYPIYIAWDTIVKPTIALLGAIRRVDGGAFTLSSAVGIDWEFDNSGRIKLKGLPGLSASSSNLYEVKITFLVG